MIVVLGSITVREEHLDQALALSLEHVRRSRSESGCLSHNVHRDAENPQRLVFVEKWRDHPALMEHFAVPESNAFVKALGTLATGPPSLEILDATEVASQSA